MKTEQEIRDKIKEMEEYKEKYLVHSIVKEDRFDKQLRYEQSIHDLKWVLGEDECFEN